MQPPRRGDGHREEKDWNFFFALFAFFGVKILITAKSAKKKN
jgi:hypothetical protein